MHQVGECLRFLVGCEGGKRRMECGMSRAHSEQILWVMVLPMFDREMAITCTDIHASHDVDRDVYSFVISLNLSRSTIIPSLPRHVKLKAVIRKVICFRATKNPLPAIPRFTSDARWVTDRPPAHRIVFRPLSD